MGRTIGQPLTGAGTTGLRNTGLWDTGLRNTGLRDTGLRNTGLRDAGLRDIGAWNAAPLSTAYSTPHGVSPHAAGSYGTGPDEIGSDEIGSGESGRGGFGLEPGRILGHIPDQSRGRDRDGLPDRPPGELSDPEAAGRSRRGRQAPENLRDFDAFYLGTKRRVTAQVVAMLGDPGGVEDAVQEAYARAWQRWSEVSEMADPASWVRVVAYRIKISTWRSATRRLAAYRRHGPAEDIPEHGPETVMLVAALRKLPEAQRQALVLYHVAGMTIDEVAAQVGAPAGTVKARLSRGRAAMAELLTDPAERDQSPGSGPGTGSGPGSGGSPVTGTRARPAARKRATASDTVSKAGSKAARTATPKSPTLRRLSWLRPRLSFSW